VASGSGDKTIRLWDVATGKPHHSGRTQRSCDCVTLARRKKTGLVELDTSAVVWDVATGKSLDYFVGPLHIASSVVSAPMAKCCHGDFRLKLPVICGIW